MLNAIRAGTDPRIERPFDNNEVTESVGSVVDLIGERYLAREQSVSLDEFRGWEAIEQQNKSFGKWESLNIALYKKGDTHIAVILGVTGDPRELIREAKFVGFGGELPESYKEAFDTLERWRQEYPDLIVAGHSKGGSIAALYGGYTGTPTIALEPFANKATAKEFMAASCRDDTQPVQVLNLVSAFTPWKDGITSKQEIIGATRSVDTSSANNSFHAHDMRLMRSVFNMGRIEAGTPAETVGPVLQEGAQSPFMQKINNLPSLTKMLGR